VKATSLAGAAVAGATSLSAVGCASDDQRSGSDGRLSIRIAGYPYDRVQSLVAGDVSVEGADVRFTPSNIYDLNRMAMGGDQEWEVQEIGLHPYMLAYANNAFRDYTLIPVFTLRTFRHKSIFIRTDRGINAPEDLRGKTVAVAGYSQSSLVWIRGILQHEYGVTPQDMQWVIAVASSDSGTASGNEVVVPEGIDYRIGPARTDESDLLESGEVDAVFSAVEPRGYVEGDPTIDRLFSDYRTAERNYFAATGIFPIMHAVAMRNDVVEANPGLPKAVFEAYCQAKHQMYQEMHKLGWAMISLPWVGKELEDTRELMGDNYWPYGIAENRNVLEAVFLYSYEQGLSSRQLTIEELFHPTTLELRDTPS
jgi:4,5-dihydroxyphthalate decarboxylase